MSCTLMWLSVSNSLFLEVSLAARSFEGPILKRRPKWSKSTRVVLFVSPGVTRETRATRITRSVARMAALSFIIAPFMDPRLLMWTSPPSPPSPSCGPCLVLCSWAWPGWPVQLQHSTVLLSIPGGRGTLSGRDNKGDVLDYCSPVTVLLSYTLQLQGIIHYLSRLDNNVRQTQWIQVRVSYNDRDLVKTIS